MIEFVWGRKRLSATIAPAMIAAVSSHDPQPVFGGLESSFPGPPLTKGV
jgi:hypothetical protein